MSVKRKAEELAVSQCANYFKGCVLCPEGEESCWYERDGFLGHVRCIYFERAVLPQNETLEIEYWAEITGDKSRALADMDRCESCGERFKKRSNRHKFCASCAEIRHRDRSRENMRRHRGKGA